MGIFDRIFGSGTTVDKIRKAYSREDWATVLVLAEETGDLLSAEESRLVEELTRSSGDQLAAINLEQAEACSRASDGERAREHLELALTYARSADLLAKAHEIRKKLDAGHLETPVVADNCISCNSGSSVNRSTPSAESEIEPPEDAWELTLAALPPGWAERYAQLAVPLQEAVLLAHAGQDAEAKRIFLATEREELCEVSRYELASLFLRCGELDLGAELLEDLLQTVPDHDLALLLAIDLAMQQQLPWLQPRLNANLATGLQPGLSHAGLAKLAALQGDEEELVEHSRSAVQLGHFDQELLIWTSRALEKRGQMGEAEAMLRHLPGGGCSGGGNPLLGEFWLRCRKYPDQALESFKNAARQDPENPRWALRIAQCYLHKGWTKEANAMLRQILRTPQLDESLREEAQSCLRELQDS
jgi:tetratricopeptide (TPR) repeat protein